MAGAPALPQPATAADRASAKAFFRGRPAAHATFEEIRRFMATCGPMEMASTKSRVAFLARTRFLWVHEAHLDGSITMGFLLPRRAESPRLRSGPAGGRWSHHVKLDRLDGELKAWFREAYEWDGQAIRDAPVSVPRAARKPRTA